MKRSDEIAEEPCLGDGLAAPQLNKPSSCRLTLAEKKILACVSMAKTNKEIAGELHISPATVKRHLENILRKLGLRNRVEAALYGLMTNGCSGAMSSACALHKWWNERIEPARANDSWAI